MRSENPEKIANQFFCVRLPLPHLRLYRGSPWGESVGSRYPLSPQNVQAINIVQSIYRKDIAMNNEEKNTGIPITGIQNYFLRLSNDRVFVNSECVFTEEPHTLRIGEVYEVIDMRKEGVNRYFVKLLWVYLKGMTFNIIAVDVMEGDLIHLSQRLGNDSIPCDFLVADILYFDVENLSTKILRGLTDNDMELLEFEFDKEQTTT